MCKSRNILFHLYCLRICLHFFPINNHLFYSTERNLIIIFNLIIEFCVSMYRNRLVLWCQMSVWCKCKPTVVVSLVVSLVSHKNCHCRCCSHWPALDPRLFPQHGKKIKSELSLLACARFNARCYAGMKLASNAWRNTIFLILFGVCKTSIHIICVCVLCVRMFECVLTVYPSGCETRKHPSNQDGRH